MLQNIQDYVDAAPNGLDILNDTVQRRFPLDDTWVPYDDPRAFATTSSVADVIQEILQRHASGIHFREYNAGPNLDMQMSDPGFNIDIEVDWKTGVIYGGNEHNCGTWQDKMVRALSFFLVRASLWLTHAHLPCRARARRRATRASRARLATARRSRSRACTSRPSAGSQSSRPRASSRTRASRRRVRSLSSCALPVLARARKADPLAAAVDGKERFVSYQEWDDLLQKSFERLYYVPADPALDAQYDVDPSLVARRGIYKDVHGTPAPRSRADYQLRGQFPIAMAVAPELFTPKFALDALAVLEANLVGPLGVKTLDPADPDYRGVYDNSNDSDDYHVAKGRNYHQGPEWVWPMGASRFPPLPPSFKWPVLTSSCPRPHRVLPPCAPHL